MEQKAASRIQNNYQDPIDKAKQVVGMPTGEGAPALQPPATKLGTIAPKMGEAIQGVEQMPGNIPAGMARPVTQSMSSAETPITQTADVVESIGQETTGNASDPEYTPLLSEARHLAKPITDSISEGIALANKLFYGGSETLVSEQDVHKMLYALMDSSDFVPAKLATMGLFGGVLKGKEAMGFTDSDIIYIGGSSKKVKPSGKTRNFDSMGMAFGSSKPEVANTYAPYSDGTLNAFVVDRSDGVIVKPSGSNTIDGITSWSQIPTDSTVQLPNGRELPLKQFMQTELDTTNTEEIGNAFKRKGYGSILFKGILDPGAKRKWEGVPEDTRDLVDDITVVLNPDRMVPYFEKLKGKPGRVSGGNRQGVWYDMPVEGVPSGYISQSQVDEAIKKDGNPIENIVDLYRETGGQKFEHDIRVNLPTRTLNPYREFDRELIDEVSPSGWTGQKTGDEYKAMSESMAKEGVKNPVMIFLDHDLRTGELRVYLAEGNHRLRAAQEQGIEMLPVEIRSFASRSPTPDQEKEIEMLYTKFVRALQEGKQGLADSIMKDIQKLRPEPEFSGESVLEDQVKQMADKSPEAYAEGGDVVKPKESTATKPKSEPMKKYEPGLYKDDAGQYWKVDDKGDLSPYRFN